MLNIIVGHERVSVYSNGEFVAENLVTHDDELQETVDFITDVLDHLGISYNLDDTYIKEMKEKLYG